MYIDVQLADAGEYTIFLRNSSNQVHSVTKVNIIENLNKIKKSKNEGLFFYESKLVILILKTKLLTNLLTYILL